MSNHLISESYKRQVGSMARKAVMVLLADKASDDGTGIWASKQTMADEIGTTKQTIIATIKGLIADGLIREAGQRKSPNGYTVEYAIAVAVLRSLPMVKCHADQSSKLTGQTALPVKEDDLTGQAALPDQSSGLTQTLQNPPEPPKEEAKASRAADPFPRPDWANPAVWSDWMDIRKTKKARNTATAYAGFLSDIAKLTNDEWPPGRLLEHAVRKSWAGIYEPKEGYPTNGRLSGQNDNAGIRGNRPNPALDMLLQAERELQAEAQRENTGAGWPPRAALPSC